MKKTLPRILIAAAQSGSGKTTLTCGLLQALLQRSITPAAFKCGPDYIDPLFHASVLGTKGGNLDLFFTDENTARALLCENAADAQIAVLEGVMGFYDGVGGVSDTASAYHLSKATQTPVLLCIDARGASLSLCAQIKGFQSFRAQSGIAAVFLNRCTKMQHDFLKPVIEAECGVKVLGYLPQNPIFSLESRHLGLVTAAEVENLRDKISAIAAEIETCVDINALLQLAESAPELAYEPLSVQPITNQKPRIAVAQDKAFCFYYAENLQLLQALGAEIVPFSPLADADLPPDVCALYLGGGYPELYAAALAKNKSMRSAVHTAAQNGMPLFAECGGFLYLHDTLYDLEGNAHAMAGVLPAACRNTGKLSRFGYVTLTAQKDTILCAKGEKIAAHEFHYYDSDENGAAFLAEKPMRRRSWQCIMAQKNIFAGFPHFYFYANTAFAARFVAAAQRYRKEHA